MRVHVLDHQPQGDPFLMAMATGMSHHNAEVEHFTNRTDSDADLVVTWGVTGWRRDLVRRRKKRGLRTLVIERGYIGDRMRNASVGFDGLNGRADFVSDHADPARARWIINRLSPGRKPRGSYILLIGQVESDSAVRGLNYKQWVINTANSLREVYPDLPIVFRPHPNKRAQWRPQKIPICGMGLSDAMQGAYGIVTLNSNVGVLAMIDGHPIIAHDKGSMVHMIAETGHTFHQCPGRPRKERWAVRMASAQWNTTELASGEAWDHLKKGMYRVQENVQP